MKIKTTTFQTRTDTATQDITITDFGTPTAVLFVMNGENTTSAGVTADAIIGFGATDGTNQWAIGASDRHGVSLPDTYRMSDEDWCIKAIEDANGYACCAAIFDSWITDGIRIDWNYNILSTGIYITAIFIQCDGAKVGYKKLSDGSSDAVTVSGIGFESDVVMPFNIGFNTLDGVNMYYLMSAGFSVNGGSQRCVAQTSTDGTATSVGKIMTTVLTDASTCQLVSDALTWKASIENFTATGFDINPNANPDGDYVFYLALDLGDAQAWAGTIDTPTSTGNDAQTGPGFEPSAVISLLSMCSAVDTVVTTGAAGSYGMSVIDSDGNEYCHAVTMEDGAGTTNTDSIYAQSAVDLNNDDGTAAIDASYVSMDSNGWTLNYSAVDATARKWAVLAIGDAAATPTFKPFWASQATRISL